MLNMLALAGAVYGGAVLLMYVFQDRLLYFPTEEHIGTPTHVGLSYEDVWLETNDGERLHAWWVPAGAPRGTVLFCHGNAGNISGRLHSIDLFHRLSLNVLIFDYRGFGRSTGSPSEEGIYRDVEAAFRHTTEERGIPAEEIVLFGRSLGGAPAAWLAAREPAAALILESAFTSLPALAQELYPIFPARHLARSSFNTIDRLPEVEMPVLVIHSREDELIPYEHGRRLYEAAREPRVFYELEGGHSEGFLIGGASYHDALDRFFSAHLQ